MIKNQRGNAVTESPSWYKPIIITFLAMEKAKVLL